MPPFRLVSDFAPAGDQPRAIGQLAESIEGGNRYQTLLGITGSGKSATIAWTIEQVQRPTLVLAPNKSLAAQLANEFREFFPENRVEYFVSWPVSGWFVTKSDRMRMAATSRAALTPSIEAKVKRCSAPRATWNVERGR